MNIEQQEAEVQAAVDELLVSAEIVGRSIIREAYPILEDSDLDDFVCIYMAGFTSGLSISGTA